MPKANGCGNGCGQNGGCGNGNACGPTCGKFAVKAACGSASCDPCNACKPTPVRDFFSRLCSGRLCCESSTPCGGTTGCSGCGSAPTTQAPAALPATQSPPKEMPKPVEKK